MKAFSSLPFLRFSLSSRNLAVRTRYTPRFSQTVKQNAARFRKFDALGKDSSERSMSMMNDAIQRDSFHGVQDVLKDANLKKTESLELYNLALNFFLRKNNIPRFWWTFSNIEKKFSADEITFGIALKRYSDVGDIEKLEQMVDLMESRGIQFNEILLNTIIGAYSKAGMIEKAAEWFEMFEKLELPPTPTTFCALVRGHMDLGDYKKCEELFFEFQNRHGMLHDAISYSMMISAMSSAKQYEKARLFYNEGIEVCQGRLGAMHTRLIDMYKDYGDMTECWEIFESIRGAPSQEAIASMCNVITARGETEYFPRILGVASKYPQLQENSVLLRYIAKGYFTNGEIQKGLKIFEHILEIHPMIRVGVASLFNPIPIEFVPEDIRERFAKLKKFLEPFTKKNNRFLDPFEALNFLDIVKKFYVANELEVPELVLKRETKYRAEAKSTTYTRPRFKE